MSKRIQIDFRDLRDRILMVLYQEYLDDSVVWTTFAEIAKRTEPTLTKAVRDELNDQIDNGHVRQHSRQRQTNISSTSALLGLGGPQYEEVPLDGYRLTKEGITLVNRFSDEVFDELLRRIGKIGPEATIIHPSDIARVGPVEGTVLLEEDVWTPLPLDVQSSEFQEAIAKSETAIESVRQSNGFSVTDADTRDAIVENASSTLEQMKRGTASRGQIIENLLKPLRFIAKKFAETSVAELAKAAIVALIHLISGI